MTERYKQQRLELSVPSNTIPKKILEGRSDDFVLWAEKGRTNGHLYRLIETLRMLGLSDDIEDALNILEEISSEHDGSALSLRSSDFTGRVFLNGTKRVLKKLNGHTASPDQQESAGLVDLNFGSISHRGIVDLYSGLVGNQTWHTVTGISQESVLFDQNPYSIVRPLEPHEYTPSSGFDPDYIGEIDYLWNLNASILQSDPTLIHDAEYQQEFNRLEELISPLYGKHLIAARNLAEKSGRTDRYMYTAMMWANAAVHASQRGPSPLFSELPVFNWSQNGFDGGRVDALEVLSIDGQQVSDEEWYRLYEMRESSYSSSGQLASLLMREFGAQNIQTRIIDFKFAIGDAPRRGTLTSAEEINTQPIPRHRSQVQKYLTLAPIDLATHTLDESAELADNSIWNNEDSFPEGEIWYFHPFQPPVIHTISLSSEEKSELFGTYRKSLHHAKNKAKIRMLDRNVGRFVESMAQRTKYNPANGKQIDPRVEALLSSECSAEQ